MVSPALHREVIARGPNFVVNVRLFRAAERLLLGLLHIVDIGSHLELQGQITDAPVGCLPDSSRNGL